LSFVHLHRHSEYSRLDGLGSATHYAQRAADLDQFALAQTDHGTLSGALEHIEACRIAGVLPISGVEAYFRPDRSSKDTRQAWHLCLYAKNLRGWHNLLRIVSVAYGEIEDGGGFYQYPCVDYELLRKYSEGLACSSACVSGWLSNLIEGGDSVAVREYIDTMTSIFGEDFWLEIMPHDFEQQKILNKELVGISQERGIGIIATNDAHFPYQEWAETHKIAKMCGASTSFSKLEKDKEKGKAGYLSELNPTLYLCTEEEMIEWFSANHPDITRHTIRESLDNTELFVQRTTPFLLDKSPKLPKVAENEQSPAEILREWIDEGMERILAEYPDSHWERWPKELYYERIESEFEILDSKGVIDYFVLVGDVVRWARKEGIRVGLGRGSAAGCLISYLVGIVAIDPISWGLLFERFLNPERKGLPDIDLDFQSERRSEVKAYIARKYGADHVADIITHSRFQPKSAIQDLCRVYDVPYDEAHAVTDTIEIRQDDEDTTLEEILPNNEKLQEFKRRHQDIWEHALRIEGSVKNAGKHAAGIIITPKPVVEYMALERGKQGDLVTSWSDAADFPVVSDYGFLKIDALGISGLDRHAYACDLIKRRHGKEIDLYSLGPLRNPYDVDMDVMSGFANGYTIGIFQFGSRGITNLLKDINPDVAFDLAAANALYRPGPMKGGVTWDYAKRKRGGDFDTWHEAIKPILSETYGLVTYQEQVMEISKQIGGFSGAEADDLRKAMGKLYRIKGGSTAKTFMKRFEEKWFEGCVDRDIDKTTANEIWRKILEFGHYGFNKSHSASYALQAYQDMYLKIKYPLEFYAAILTYPSGSKPKEKQDFVAQVIREARLRGIKILPPCVNRSEVGWSVDDEGIRVGLLAIKGVGEVGARTIIENRENGLYDSMQNFRDRIAPRAINNSALIALQEAGAFDFCDGRSDASQNQISIWERDRLGMNLTVAADIQKYASLIEQNIHTQEEVAENEDGTVVVGGEIVRIDRKTTKRGSPFATVILAYGLNEWRIRFWKESLEMYGDLLSEGQAIMVAGPTDSWNGTVSVVCQHAASVEQFAKEMESNAS
jgi:DNA polymerase-3 subunit alpha